jgi:hypothetical protein
MTYVMADVFILLCRLFDSAKAMAFINIPTRDWVTTYLLHDDIANLVKRSFIFVPVLE